MQPAEIEKMFTYHAPNDSSLERLRNVRGKAMELAHLINTEIPECADKSASIRLLREAVMTANAAIVLNQTT